MLINWRTVCLTFCPIWNRMLKRLLTLTMRCFQHYVSVPPLPLIRSRVLFFRFRCQDAWSSALSFARETRRPAYWACRATAVLHTPATVFTERQVRTRFLRKGLQIRLRERIRKRQCNAGNQVLVHWRLALALTTLILIVAQKRPRNQQRFICFETDCDEIFILYAFCTVWTTLNDAYFPPRPRFRNINKSIYRPRCGYKT